MVRAVRRSSSSRQRGRKLVALLASTGAVAALLVNGLCSLAFVTPRGLEPATRGNALTGARNGGKALTRHLAWPSATGEEPSLLQSFAVLEGARARLMEASSAAGLVSPAGTADLATETWSTAVLRPERGQQRLDYLRALHALETGAADSAVLRPERGSKRMDYLQALQALEISQQEQSLGVDSA